MLTDMDPDALKKKILIFTVTLDNYTFPENFSCWCAGALQARGGITEMRIVNVEALDSSVVENLVKVQSDMRSQFSKGLAVVDRLVCIIPEYENMYPDGVTHFMKAIATAWKQPYRYCKLVTLHLKPASHLDKDEINRSLFKDPLEKLDHYLGAEFRTKRTQIHHEPNGDMCNLFATFYGELSRLIENVLD